MKKILFYFFIIGVLFSCKDENVITNPDLISLQASRDHLTAERIFNDLERTIEDGFIDNGESKDCPNYIMHNANMDDNSDTLIIDFGNGSPTCINYGKIKKGKIIIIYTGKYRDSLTTMTTSFDNYHVNNNLIQGERIVRNEGRNSAGNIWFSIEVNNASISTENGTINWSANRTREWVEGSDTFGDISDDQYIINGEASGESVNGNSFTMTITEPLHINLGCLPSCIIQSGENTIIPDGYNERIINYGDSICDCNVNINVGGTLYPVVIN